MKTSPISFINDISDQAFISKIRIPSTYAYDFLRTYVNEGKGLSRADVANRLRSFTEDDKYYPAFLYLFIEHPIEIALLAGELDYNLLTMIQRCNDIVNRMKPYLESE